MISYYSSIQQDNRLSASEFQRFDRTHKKNLYWRLYKNTLQGIQPETNVELKRPASQEQRIKKSQFQLYIENKKRTSRNKLAFLSNQPSSYNSKTKFNYYHVNQPIQQNNLKTINTKRNKFRNHTNLSYNNNINKQRLQELSSEVKPPIIKFKNQQENQNHTEISFVKTKQLNMRIKEIRTMTPAKSNSQYSSRHKKIREHFQKNSNQFYRPWSGKKNDPLIIDKFMLLDCEQQQF